MFLTCTVKTFNTTGEVVCNGFIVSRRLLWRLILQLSVFSPQIFIGLFLPRTDLFDSVLLDMSWTTVEVYKVNGKCYIFSGQNLIQCRDMLCCQRVGSQ